MNDLQLYFQLGLNHILNQSSVDHILFLWALILVFKLSDWRKLLGLVSLFTIAHTISLILSVFGVLKVNELLIENLILYTIIITALSNIVISNPKINHQLHYYFSFFFGLIHGLGFAKDFKMMVVGQSNKLFSLLYFAMGIEIAQVILGLFILLIVWLLLKIFKTSHRQITLLVSASIVGFVLALLYS